MVQASGLLRRLLIDGTPLYVPVNRSFRFKPTFRWHHVLTATPARGGLAWVPGCWLDPVLIGFDPALQEKEVKKSLDKNPPHEGNLDGLLAYPVIIRDEDTVTVKELIKHYANREGGVHYDSGPPDRPLLDDLRAESEEALRLTILAIGRIAYRGLEPLATAVMLAERPTFFGLH